MNVAFFVVMLIIDLAAAIDITNGDKNSEKFGSSNGAGALGISPARNKTPSIILYAITTAALVAMLILEMIV